jgi:hypothetical protein
MTVESSGDFWLPGFRLRVDARGPHLEGLFTVDLVPTGYYPTRTLTDRRALR